MQIANKQQGLFLLFAILIEPQWNVDKFNGVEVQNNNIILIEPQWNVDTNEDTKADDWYVILIEPQWNVDS